MSFLASLDQWIIGVLERYTQKFQRLTGKTNFFLAKIAALVIAIATYAELKVGIEQSGMFKPIHFADYFIFALWLATVIWLVDSVEKIVHRGSLNQTSNFTKYATKFKWLRCTWFIVAVGFTFLRWLLLMFGISVYDKSFTLHILRRVEIWGVGLYFYLIACDPLPPCIGKIQQLTRAWFSRTQPQQTRR